MQCQQPLFGISLPLPGPSQFIPGPSVNPINGLAPDVIGEGEVNAITFPDGSVQYYFLPVRWHTDIYWKRWPPYPFNDNMFCNYSKPNTGAWIIRNFSNTISPVYNQYWQKTNLDAFTNPCFSYDGNVIPTSFPLKFHNDCWTSTTDLHYFCPRITVAPPIANCTTAAQSEMPNQMQYCSHNIHSNDSDKNEYILNITKEYNNLIHHYTKLEKDTYSRMSVDKEKTSSSSMKTSASSSKTSLKKSKHRKKSGRRKATKKNIIPCQCHKDCTANKTEEDKNHKNKLNESDCQCEIDLQKEVDTDVSTDAKHSKKKGPRSGQRSPKVTFLCGCDRYSDKGVTTYTDQASNVKEQEGQTQTCRRLTASDVSASTLTTSTRTISPNTTCPESSEKLLDICDFCDSDESLCPRCRHDISTDSVD